MSLSGITRRDVCDADRPFLLELYASTRQAEMAMVPWTPQQKSAFVQMQFLAQLAGYRETYPDAIHEIIVAEDRPAGRVWLDRRQSELHILDVTIDPVCRNAGIGSAVIREILLEGDRTGKRVTIYVEDFNRSRGLFERLGFRVAHQDGFQLLLERLPSARGEESYNPPGAASSGD
jgi:ribosomal protein S18 acetylase RimI-like enzyme